MLQSAHSDSCSVQNSIQEPMTDTPAEEKSASIMRKESILNEHEVEPLILQPKEIDKINGIDDSPEILSQETNTEIEKSSPEIEPGTVDIPFENNIGETGKKSLEVEQGTVNSLYERNSDEIEEQRIIQSQQKTQSQTSSQMDQKAAWIQYQAYEVVGSGRA